MTIKIPIPTLLPLVGSIIFTLSPYTVYASQFTGSATAVTTIGSVSSACPQGWPTAHGYITQGPEGALDHARLLADYNESAIDIGSNTTGTPTYATFSGTVLVANTQYTPGVGYGIYVDIQGTCNGTAFTGRWAHLDYIDSAIQVGSKVNFGQLIGGIDSTGNSTGTHLHYSFIGLAMGTPYIPKNPAYPSCGRDDGTACGVFW